MGRLISHFHPIIYSCFKKNSTKSTALKTLPSHTHNPPFMVHCSPYTWLQCLLVIGTLVTKWSQSHNCNAWALIRFRHRLSLAKWSSLLALKYRRTNTILCLKRVMSHGTFWRAIQYTAACIAAAFGLGSFLINDVQNILFEITCVINEAHDH